MTRMLAREYTEQKTDYWHNDVFAKIEARWSRIISRDLQYLRRFSVCLRLQVVQPPARLSLTEVKLTNTWEWERVGVGNIENRTL